MKERKKEERKERKKVSSWILTPRQSQGHLGLKEKTNNDQIKEIKKERKKERKKGRKKKKKKNNKQTNK